MLHEEYQSITLNNIDVSQYIEEFESNDISDAFEDFKFSDNVLDSDITDVISMMDEYEEKNINDSVFDTPQSPVVPTNGLVCIRDTQMDNIAIVNDLYEEIIIEEDINQISEKINENPFESLTDNMMVKEQPKADQRARYKSDGLRFLPDARKHSMSIQLPDLSSKICKLNEMYGIILTMVTSTNNPKNQTFIHVNDIKYHTNDTIQLDNGSIFLPITKVDMKTREKIFPRLSIICKKFDEYTFDLTTFNLSMEDRLTEKYTLINEDTITKSAKGKQFTIDYDLLCYKIIFQLAFKRNDQLFISHIKCETNIINEQKTPMKRKASSNKKISKKKRLS